MKPLTKLRNARCGIHQIGARKREMLSTRKIAVEEVPRSEASKQLHYKCRALKETWDGSADLEAMSISSFGLESWEWLNLPRKNV